MDKHTDLPTHAMDKKKRRVIQEGGDSNTHSPTVITVGMQRKTINT